MAKRLLRVGKWTLFVLGSALALWPLGMGVFAWRAEARLKRTLTELVNQGEPVRLSQLAEPPIPDSDNAATVYSQAFAATRLTDEDAKSAEDILSGKLTAADPNVVSRAAAIVERNRTALALIHRASAMPRCQFQIDWEKGIETTFPHLAGLRQCARLAQLESVALALADRPDAAVDACGIIFQIGDVADGPSFILELTKYACIDIGVQTLEVILRESEPSPAACQALAVRLAREDLMSSFKRSLQGERVSGISDFEGVRSARDPFKAVVELEEEHPDRRDHSPTRTESNRRFHHSYFTRWLFASDEVAYLEAMAQLIKQAPRFYREVQAALSALEEPQSRLLEPHVMTALLLPSFRRSFDQRDRRIATLGLSRVALLLRAYRAGRGLYPKSLPELEQVLAEKLPQDPFSGKPFAYRREGTGFVLYSWGVNLRDDGGTPPPAGHRDEGDIVFRCLE